MATEVKKRKKSQEKIVTFKCQFCGESRPIKEMTVIARLFPLTLACRKCEEKMR